MSKETNKILEDAKKHIDKILQDHIDTLLAEEEARHKSPIRNWLYKSWKGFLDMFGIEKVNLKKSKWVGLSDTNEQIQCFWDGSYGSGAKLITEMREKHPLMGYARIGSSRSQQALNKVAKIMAKTERQLAPLFFAAYKKLCEEIIGKGFGDMFISNAPKPASENLEKLSVELAPPKNGL